MDTPQALILDIVPEELRRQCGTDLLRTNLGMYWWRGWIRSDRGHITCILELTDTTWRVTYSVCGYLYVASRGDRVGDWISEARSILRQMLIAPNVYYASCRSAT